jgi:hypothetical protein
VYVVDHIAAKPAGTGHTEFGGPLVKIVQYKTTLPEMKGKAFRK